MATKAQVEAEAAEARKESTVLAACLAASVKGTVLWFKARGGVRAGFVNPGAPCGGYVITCEAGTISGHYFDEWAEAVERRMLAGISGAVEVATLVREMKETRHRLTYGSLEYVQVGS